MTWHLKHERSIFKHYSSLDVTTGTYTHMMILLVFKQTTMWGVKIKKMFQKETVFFNWKVWVHTKAMTFTDGW